MTRNRAGVLILAILSAILGVLAWKNVEQRRQEQREGAQVAWMGRQADAEREQREKLAHGDVDMEARLPRAYQRPVSTWRAAEKQRYEAMLAKRRFDTLVVPFQVQDHAFARDIRSLMTAQLALAMAASPGAKVSIADPHVVARAFGDGERRYDLAEVLRLANAFKVARVVMGYVGHDGSNNMRLTLQYFQAGATGEYFTEHAVLQRDRSGGLMASRRLQSRHFEKLAYSDTDTPIDVYRRLLPDMLAFLGMDPAAFNSAKAVSRLDKEALPQSPKEMFAANAGPARDAYHFQLLAALAPKSAERARERLTEKSMLAVLGMAPESPDYRALKARALMNMGLRPAALHVLENPMSAEEKHLVAVLNGNLPEAHAAREQIPPGLRSTIAALEENAMAAAYGARSQKSSLREVAALKLPGEVWPFLVARAMTDWDSWTQHDNLSVKGLLDHEFPIPGFTAQSMVEGASAIGDLWSRQVSMELAALDHVRRQLRAVPCCEPSMTALPGTADYLEVIEGIATANLLGRAKFFTRTQGRPEAALQFLASIESVYRDHPQFVVARGEAQLGLAKTADGAEKEGLLRSANAEGFNGWYWEQGQTLTADDAFEVISDARRRDYGRFDNLYLNDYPPRSAYSFWQSPGDQDVLVRNAQRALQYSTFDIEPVVYIDWALSDNSAKYWDQVDQVLKSIEHRFIGHPKRARLLAQASVRRGDLKSAENHYRDGIRAQPNDHGLYEELGKALFETGAVEQSADLFMSYPGLKDPSVTNPVDLSNYAYFAGSLFYWSGGLESAIPLYRAAADLNTGSNASMASRLRLQLIDGDYIGALRGSLERARRYESAHAYRDYFGLLHAMGHSKEAWDGFMSLIRRDMPQVWETALVAHRRDAMGEAQMAAWAAQEPVKSAGVRHPYAAMYLARAGVMDRTPTEKLPSLIAAIERPVWRLEEGRYVHVVRQSGGGGIDHVALGPNSPTPATLPRGLLESERIEKVRVKSDYVYLAEIYRALRTGNFAAARDASHEASTFYDFRNPSLGYLLPFYAFAAARSGDTASVEALLQKFDERYRRFDYHLARAAILGIAGKHAEAMQHIDLARYRRPFTEDRPVFTEYQFAELCEWLFDVTGNRLYRDTALQWAQKSQVVQPWFAWAYAVEAKLSSKPAERRRAIAMAHYLDPRSERLSRLPRREVNAAVKEFAGRNPFLRPAAVKPKERA